MLELVKQRCSLLTDFWEHSFFFFEEIKQYHTESIQSKWSEEKRKYFHALIESLPAKAFWSASNIEGVFKKLAEESKLKPGDLQLPLRIMLVGGKFGPPVFEIAEILGKEQTIERIRKALDAFDF